MSRPPLEVADLIRSAGMHSSNEIVLGSTGSISKYCGRFGVVVLPLSAVISMSAGVADIAPPSRITAVAIGIAQSVRPAPGNGGSLRAKENCSHALCPCRLHPPTPLVSTSPAEQEGHLRSSVPQQCRNAARSRSRSQTSRRGDRLLQRLTHVESKARAFIRMSTVSFPPAACRSITPWQSFTRRLLSSQSMCCVASFAASSLPVSKRRSRMAN